AVMNVVGPGPVISDKGKTKLIEFVRGQEAIWNPKCPEYPKLELKFAAWQQVQKQMKENGFDFQVSFLRRVWNNLLVYWKKNLRYDKKAIGKEWTFGKSMNFLTSRYGSAYPHTKSKQKTSRVLKSHDPDDYDMEDEDDLSDDDWRAGTLADSSSRLDDDSISITGTDIEVEARPSSQGGTKSFSQGNYEEGADGQEFNSQKGELDSTSRSYEGDIYTKSDKFDKFAAFLASALREMPEKESRKKMKDIMFILLEDAAPPKS
ncbi:hypothetical protein V3C99_016110, partial [Haemonchus contortus]